MSLESRLRPRPLSPHLAVYRRTMTMMMSIAHRLTGTALYFGTLLLTWWLIAAAEGQKSYQLFESWIGSPAGKFVLLCYTWALIHHLLGGLRHFAWDIGQGFDLPTANLMARATLIGSLILTVLVWTVGIWMRGHFNERHAYPIEPRTRARFGKNRYPGFLDPAADGRG